LNAVNIVGKKLQAPWNLSFSFGRALQASCIKTWRGLTETTENAQKILLLRANMNGLSAIGEYPGEEEGASLFEKS